MDAVLGGGTHDSATSSADANTDLPPPLDAQASACVFPSQRLLPAKNITEIITSALPRNVKLSSQVTSLVQEMSTDFIGFVASEAASVAASEGRHTIHAEDLLKAMRDLDLPEYEHALKAVCGEPKERGRKSKARSSVSASSSTCAAQHDPQTVGSSQSSWEEHSQVATSFEMPSAATELADLLAEYGAELEGGEPLSQRTTNENDIH